MVLRGENADGWRFMSTVFGGIALGGIFALSWLLLSDLALALLATALTALNHLWYVESRIAMTDAFMVGWLVWATAAFVAALQTKRSPKTRIFCLYGSGLAFGLATCCKWSAIFPWAAAGLLWTWVHARRQNAKMALHTVAAWVLVPLAAYLLPFLYYFFIPELDLHWATLLGDLWRLQTRMFDYQWHYSYHPFYRSSWDEWVIMKRIMIFARNAVSSPETPTSIIALIGNPVVMWGGLLALVRCVWVASRPRLLSPAFFVAYFYFASLLPWVFLNRSSGAYYYYYPSGILLSLAIAVVLQEIKHRASRRAYLGSASLITLASVVLFIYFFPVLSGIPTPSSQLQARFWFPGWLEHRDE